MSLGKRSYGRHAAMVAAALLLCACANDAQRTTAEGAGAGALIGALAGQLLGGNRDATLAGAAIGAVAGGMIGNEVANKKADYAQREDGLRASANSALEMARACRAENDQRARAIAVLQQSVQSLRTQKLSAAARRNLVADNQRQQQDLVAGLDRWTKQLQGEIARQNAVIAAEQKARNEAAAKSSATAVAAAPSEGLQRVVAGVRDLQQQEQSLQDARRQLMQIDTRRAY